MQRRGFVVVVGAVLAGAFWVTAGVGFASHKTGHGTPSGPAPKAFASDFVAPKDSEWSFDIGGFGGEKRGKALAYNPVLFVHGNSEDSTFYAASEAPPVVINVRQRMKTAGYTDQEVWALSYNGARCGSNACGTANDVNVPDMRSFIQAVRDYTGSSKVDIVAHSLGVTLVRKTMFLYPELLDQIEDFVASAGANHGTSACRGVETTVFGCDEIVPGSAWLGEINSWNPKGESDETPGPVRYMTIYDGSGAGDQFYLNLPLLYDDTKSPRLSGAQINKELPNTPHFTLVRGDVAFNNYLPFIRDHNIVSRTDGGPVISPEQRRAAQVLAETGAPPWFIYGLALLAVAISFGLAGRPRSFGGMRGQI